MNSSLPVRLLSGLLALEGLLAIGAAAYTWWDVYTYTGESSTYAVGYAIAILYAAWGLVQTGLSLPGALIRRRESLGAALALAGGSFNLLGTVLVALAIEASGATALGLAVWALPALLMIVAAIRSLAGRLQTA